MGFDLVDTSDLIIVCTAIIMSELMAIRGEPLWEWVWLGIALFITFGGFVWGFMRGLLRRIWK